ncbi:helix-turn-helix domain-containing protein [Nocardia gipuzkoensis]
MDGAGIGERTARARKLARLTQLQLAQKANVSVSLLRKVERGARPASPVFIAAVAGALGVNIEDLTGQPYPPARDDAGAHATIRELRRKILAFNDEPLSAPTTLEELTAALHRVQESRRRGRYGDHTAELPDVIHGLHVLASDEPPGHRLETIYSTLAYAYNSASSIAYRYGYLDLAGLAAERCVWAAERPRSHAPSRFGYRHRYRPPAQGITGSTCLARGCSTGISIVPSPVSTRRAGSRRG